MELATGGPGAFVGRARELQMLDAGFHDACAGRVEMLALVGDAGIGKTRTVEEFVQRAALPRDRVLWGRCPEQPGAPTYWPWVRAIRAYAEAHDPDTLRDVLADDAKTIARMVPTLCDRLPGLEPADADVQDPEARFRLFDAVASFLQRTAADAPLVVVIEDVHWADEASLLLLGFVAREARSGQLLLIATYREREARRWPRAFADVARLGHRILLRGLDRAEIEDLVARASVTPPSPTLLERLQQMTEGNPFFLDEMVRVLGTTDATGDAVRLPLPDSLREAIRRRIDPLSEDERGLLSMAAVIGREFDVALLQAASALPAEVVLARLTAAAAIGVVEEQERMGAFRFTHALIRELLYGDLLPAARAQLHRRVAAALETDHGSDADDASLDALAIHYFHAAPLGAAEKAFEYSMRAGRAATKLAAYGDAMAHYERALSALALQPPDERRRLTAAMAHGLAAWRAGHNPKARDSYRVAARCARALGDGERFVLAATLHAQASPPSGAPDATVIALLEEALTVVGEVDSAGRATVLALLPRALYFTSALDRCRALSREAVEMARRVGDPLALVVAVLGRQLVLLGPGSTDERMAFVDESHRIATEHGMDAMVHNGRLTRVLCLLERGEVAAASNEIELMRLGAERARLPERQWHAMVPRAAVAMLLGRFEEAARVSAEALAVRRDASDAAASHVFLVQAYIGRSETGHATGLEDSIRRLASDFPAVPAWRCILALLLAETKRAEAARPMLDELGANGFAGVRRDFLYPAALGWLARLAALLGDGERARELYALLLPFADRNIVVSLYSPGCLGSAHAYLGLLAATFGDQDVAARHFDAALAMNERMGARPFLARTQLWYARLLIARDGPGDRGRASALLTASREIADACGMASLVAELGNEGGAEPARTPEREAPKASVLGATLRRDVDFWTVRYGADAFRLKDMKGLRFLQTLLQHPGQDLHVVDLAGGAAEIAEIGVREATGGAAGELLDAASRAAYKHRLEDLRDELEEAERFNDRERALRARSEIEFLGEELARAVGLGGRDRNAGSATERARVNVTRTIAAVLKKISASSPALGEHLTATIRTGYFCSYTPDPRRPVSWSL